ncbi:MAG: cation transporter [Bacteroidota bacterium]
MKYLGIILSLAFFLVSAPQDVQAQKQQLDNFEVYVDGLGCPFCAYGLEKKFKAFKGIKNIKINVETGQFTFTLPADENLSLEAVVNQVDLAGYTPISVAINRADGSKEKSAEVNPENMVWGDLSTTKFFAAGQCGMCQARIERAAKSVKGVKEASWTKKTKLLTIEYDPAYTTKEAVVKAVAQSGHDTKTAKANDEKYESLPGCCHYERIQ